MEVQKGVSIYVYSMDELSMGGTEQAHGSVPRKNTCSVLFWSVCLVSIFSSAHALDRAEMSAPTAPFCTKIPFRSHSVYLLGPHIQFCQCLATTDLSRVN